MAKKKITLIPNDFRDFLSIISFIGFLGIFTKFTLNISWVNDNTTPLFLIIAGLSFMILGKVFIIKKWINDGIQKNEVLRILALVFGTSAIVIGSLLLFNITIPFNLLGYIGIIALIPLIYTIIDYLIKNKG